MRFFENANFNFISKRYVGYIISGFLILISLGAIIFRGLQYGIDFRGGTELVISFEEDVSVSEIRTLLTDAIGSEPQVRLYGSDRELQIRTDADLDTQKLSEVILQSLEKNDPENHAEIIKTDLIGPVFAKDIRDAAFNATIFSILVIGIYIFMRFHELSFMVAVVVTLIHDTIIIIGLFTLLNGFLPFDMDINQNLVAALLTIIGYSLNDTIVVFDRVRENRLIRQLTNWPELVNVSINQTLSRTVVTSLTTLFVVLALFLFGGSVLKGFSFALLIGIILGTYSTIFFACPLVVDLPIKKVIPKKKLKATAA